MSIVDNNKRIAKNTLMLYARMLVMTLISLYTVRVTLQILGADDYGIYNVVCGVIGFLGFITMTLNTAAQRFLAYDLGKCDNDSFTKSFSMIVYIFILLSLIIVFLAELLGPWLINNYLVIPSERLQVAKWIYQLSILSFIIRFAAIPYSASIIAHEKMSVYAYLSIFESISKLAVVFLLSISHIDKLLSYAFLLMITDITITLFYYIFCKLKLKECRIVKYWNNLRFKEMATFIGWNTFGSLSGVFTTQGMSIILNMFFPPSVIASKAIADRVNGFSYSFVANFITASSPQMTKYFSGGDIKNLVSLFFRTTKFSLYLMIVISVPLIMLVPELLKIWLADELLEDMIIFTRFTLIGTLFSAFETPISRMVHATGQVKTYQVLNCITSLISLPIVFYLFKIGLPAYWSYIISISILALSLIYRIAVLHKYIYFSYKSYLKEVVLPITIVLILSCLVGYFVLKFKLCNIIIKVIVDGLISVISIGVIVFLVGMNSDERKFIFKQLLNI